MELYLLLSIFFSQATQTTNSFQQLIKLRRNKHTGVIQSTIL